jgi:hypothetical protein
MSRTLFLASLLAALAVASPVRAQDAGAEAQAPAGDASEAPEPPELASVRGVVRYAGRDPLRLKSFTNDVDVDACGKRVASRAVRAGKRGVLRDALVEVRTPDGELVAGGRLEAADSAATVTLTGCVLEPQLLVLPLGSRVELRNVDGILHQLTGHSLRNEPVQARLPRFRRRMLLGAEHFRRAERLKVACERHSWSGGWWVATDNRFHAVTDAKGRYEITGLPPGTYLVTAWHGEFDSVEAEAVLQAGDARTLDLELR